MINTCKFWYPIFCVKFLRVSFITTRFRMCTLWKWWREVGQRSGVKESFCLCDMSRGNVLSFTRCFWKIVFIWLKEGGCVPWINIVFTLHWIRCKIPFYSISHLGFWFLILIGWYLLSWSVNLKYNVFWKLNLYKMQNMGEFNLNYKNNWIKICTQKELCWSKLFMMCLTTENNLSNPEIATGSSTLSYYNMFTFIVPVYDRFFMCLL